MPYIDNRVWIWPEEEKIDAQYLNNDTVGHSHSDLSADTKRAGGIL